MFVNNVHDAHEYIANNFPGHDHVDFTIWEQGIWPFYHVWPDAVEVTDSYGEDFSPDGYNWAVWKHLCLYQVWARERCPVW